VKIVQHHQVLNGCINRIIIINPGFQGGNVFQLLLGFLRVVPKIRPMGFFFFLLYRFDLFINVKDASSTHPGVLKDLLIGLT
jgi:hypothetical protein